MNHTKEPWEEIRKQLSHLQDDWFELDKAYIHFSNLKALLNDTFIERSKKEHIACAGIRTEALESGLIKYLLNDAYMRTLNPFDPNPQNKMDMKYLGKPVYEEDFE